MTQLFYDHDADLDVFHGKTVAIIGYGSQGHAHALNLRDSGVDVVVGLYDESPSRSQAEANGLQVLNVADAASKADVIMMLTPDTGQAQLYREEIEAHLEPGNTLMFAHGFNVRYDQISPPKSIDVSMVAPKAPGHRVREVFCEGAGTPALLAIEQDVSGRAKANALAYAKALGCTRAGVLETTFAEETETDLFGEQVVLCGGVTALIRSGFDTLVAAGYQPEIAYFECLHELKLIVDLIYRGGLSCMWTSVSDTAEHGGYEGGDRLIDKDVRLHMRHMLDEIQDGRYARRWIDENNNGRGTFDARRRQEQQHSIETVGRGLRGMMPFLQNEPRRAPRLEQGES